MNISKHFEIIRDGECLIVDNQGSKLSYNLQTDTLTTQVISDGKSCEIIIEEAMWFLVHCAALYPMVTMIEFDEVYGDADEL